MPTGWIAEFNSEVERAGDPPGAAVTIRQDPGRREERDDLQAVEPAQEPDASIPT